MTGQQSVGRGRAEHDMAWNGISNVNYLVMQKS